MATRDSKQSIQYLYEYTIYALPRTAGVSCGTVSKCSHEKVEKMNGIV